MKQQLYALGICLSTLLITRPGAGQGFAAVETPWSLPAGGAITPTTNQNLGFYLTTDTNAYSYADGSQNWTTLDLNGDHKPDLIMTSERTGGQTIAFGTAPNRYWKVYLGTGTGFSGAVTNWTLPVGGYALNGTDYGFFQTAYSTTVALAPGNQNWSTFDISGDGKADLVVTSESNQLDVATFGLAPNRYWKVYLGTNTGFATTPVNWTLPVGGAIKNNDVGFILPTYNDATYSTSTSQNWSTFDINGDGKPDLVVTSQRAANYPYYTLPFGSAPNRYWKVYLGTSTGFATTATNWPLPVGGALISGVDFGFFFSARNTANDTGSQGWSTFDVNGDGRADLVVTSQVTNNNLLTFGTVPNRYWKVYLGTGSGFATTATNWALPTGGYSYNGIDCGFLQADYPTISFSDASGTQYWSTFDISGDGKTDLVVTSQKTGTSPLTFGTVPNRYWNVYLGTGTGFAPTPTTWNVPQGGATSLSTDYGFWQPAYNTIYSPYNSLNNNNNWTTLDMNGDGQSDLVVTSLFTGTTPLPFGPPTDRYWKVYLGKATPLAATPASAADEIRLYPNPASDHLQITSAKHLLETPYCILDALGRTVQVGQLTSPFTISLRALPPGLYGVRLGQEAGSNGLLRFIKQ